MTPRFQENVTRNYPASIEFVEWPLFHRSLWSNHTH